MDIGLSTTLRRGAVGVVCGLGAALGLVACGGGGGGAGDAQPAPGESTQRIAVVNRPAAGRFALSVVDPDRPSPAALRVDFGSTTPSYAVTKAWRHDAATRSTTTTGQPWLVYVFNGRLMQVALATSASAAATPVAVSSMTDACRLWQLFELDASGREAWAVVETAGADGACSSDRFDNASAFVRIGDNPSAAPTPIDSTISIASAVRDAEGRLQWMLAQDGAVGQLSYPMPAFKADLQRANVTGIGNIDNLGLLSEGPLSEGMFIVVGPTLHQSAGEVRLLEGSSAGLRMGPPLQTLRWSSDAGAFPFLLAGPHLYGVDGQRVLRIPKTGAAEAVAELAAADGAAWFIADQSDSHLLVQQNNAAGEQAWAAVAKAGGGVRVVLRSTAAAQRKPLLLSGRQLYYRDRADAARGDIRRVDIVSGEDVLVTADIAGQGIVRPARESETPPAGPDGSALLFCQPQPTAADCRGGRLQQLDPASGAVVTLGSFAGSSVAGSWSVSGIDATQGRKGAWVQVSAIQTTAAARLTDIYTFEPGRAGSLQRVTTSVP